MQSEKTPDGEYKLAQLVRANQALYDFTVAYGVPLISGKDSMKNDYHVGGTKISIPPTVLFSVIGKVDDVRPVRHHGRQDGRATRCTCWGPPAPSWAARSTGPPSGFVGNQVPRVRVDESLLLYRALEQAIAEGLVASCHDCSDGGLAVALAETAFSGRLRHPRQSSAAGAGRGRGPGRRAPVLRDPEPVRGDRAP